MCQISLSNYCLKKIIPNWLKIIRKVRIFEFGIVPPAILLSFQEYSIDEIAAICGVHRNAVSRWINRCNEFGFKGLSDVEKEGKSAALKFGRTSQGS